VPRVLPPPPGALFPGPEQATGGQGPAQPVTRDPKRQRSALARRSTRPTLERQVGEVQGAAGAACEAGCTGGRRGAPLQFLLAEVQSLQLATALSCPADQRGSS